MTPNDVIVLLTMRAIRLANSKFYSESHRAPARRPVLIIVGSSYKSGGYNDPTQAAGEFREDGGTIITIGSAKALLKAVLYLQGDKAMLQTEGLRRAELILCTDDRSAKQRLLASCKRMLTRNLNKIDTLITRFKNEQLENVKWEEEEISPCFATNSRRRLEEGLGALEAYISKIETLLHDYTSLMEETEAPSEKESKDFEDYSAKAELILGNAMDYTVLLQARLRALKGDILAQHHSVGSRPEPADQRILLEQLQVITEQLQMKGEYVDSQWFVKQVLTKFTVDVQRKVLERKQISRGDRILDMETLYRLLDEVIANEETVALYTKKAVQPSESRSERKPKLLVLNSRVSCMYCAGDHKSSAQQEPRNSKGVVANAGKRVPGLAATKKVNHFVEEKLDQEETSVLELQSSQESLNAQERRTSKVLLEVWDNEGKPLTLTLLTSEVLTRACSPPPLLEEDLEFISSSGIEVNLKQNGANPTVPQVLLGCDQLWPLMCEREQHIQLPSGLHIVATRLGHLLSGQIQSTRQSQQKQRKNPIEDWEAVSSVSTQRFPFNVIKRIVARVIRFIRILAMRVSQRHRTPMKLSVIFCELAPNTTLAERSEASESRYHFRPRRPVNYREADVSHSYVGSLMITTMVALSMVSSNVAADKDTTHFPNSSTHFVRCLQGGVELFSPDQVPYEVCAEDFCTAIWNPRVEEKVKFPAAVALQEHTVQWKFLQGSSITVIETICPPAPFCENVDCTFCAALLFNPDCWPMGAIMVATLMSYFLITGCYVFLYVPVIMGRPFRILSCGLISIVRGIIKGFIRLFNRKGDGWAGKGKTDISLLLAILGLIITPTIECCQLVNVFPHQSEVCRESQGKQGCAIQLSEVLKINPFKREACLELMRNGTAVHRIRVSWMNLRLICERETELFTRDTVTHIDASRQRTNSFVVDVKPNIPIKLDAITLTLSSVTIPPIPLLSTRFISDGTSMALWNPSTIPPLQCDSEVAAQDLSCDVVEDCACYPAETKANCRCKNVNISEWFQKVENHLPIILPALSFRRNNKELQALVSTMTTAEIILNIQDQLQTRLSVQEMLCTGDSREISDFHWPDFLHIAGVFWQWYKTLLLSVGLLCALLASTYLYISTCGLRCLWLAIRSTARSMTSEAEGDMTPMALLYGNGYPTEDQLETDLMNVLQAFHQQIDVAATLTLQWNHVCQYGSFSDIPVHQVIQVGAYLRNAMVTKEKLLRLGTRYLLSDLLYDRTWLENRLPYDVRGTEVMLMMDRQAISLSKSIAEMELWMRETEQRAIANGNESLLTRASVIEIVQEELRRRESNNDSNATLKELKEKLRRQEIEMVQLIEKIDAMEQAQQPADVPKRKLIVEEEDGSKVLQVQVDNNTEEGALNQDSLEETDDCEYFLRMLQEVADGSPSPPPPSENTLPNENTPTKKTKHNDEKDSEEEEALRWKLERMLNDIKYYPSRRLGEWSYGIDPWIRCAFCDAVAKHFSDSCPHVSRGKDRLRILQRKGLCTHCLQFCTNSYECRSHSRPCWYCQKIKGNSFWEMLPSDEDGFQLENVKWEEEEISPCFATNSRRRLEEGLGALEAYISKIETLLHDYTSLMEETEAPSEKESKDFEDYSAKAELILEIDQGQF
ncbi:Prothymosin/parathymosin family protein [Ostertagia ostertagi]